MRIGFVVGGVASAPGFENVVSGHVQLSLHTMKLLRESGHEVQLITTAYGSKQTLPSFLPPDVAIYSMADGRRRGGGLVMEVGYRRGIRPMLLIRQVSQIRAIARRERLDILHFYGATGTAKLAGLTGLLGGNTPMVLTLTGGHLPEPFWFVTKRLWTRIAAVITSAEYMRDICIRSGLPAQLVRHGVVRDLSEEAKTTVVGPRNRVLFWRDPSANNGADVCLEVYRRLAPRFPDVDFDLAIRPHWNPVKGIDDVANEHPKVHVYRFPYAADISLGRLLAESICVLLPFRALSMQPQIAIMESMISHVPVVTTPVDSNIELINPGRNGYLVPAGDAGAATEAVEELLLDPEKASEMGDRAAEDIRSVWNWESFIPELVGIYTRALEQSGRQGRSP